TSRITATLRRIDSADVHLSRQAHRVTRAASRVAKLWSRDELVLHITTDPITAAIHLARWPAACWAPSRTSLKSAIPAPLPARPRVQLSARGPWSAFPSASNWAAAGRSCDPRARLLPAD